VDRYTYINGDWVPEAAAKIHIYDSHFMFGDAVFEMHRTFNHQHFLLDEHVDRLWLSMQSVQIPITKTKEEVKRLCQEAVERNTFDQSDEYRFMINVSRGPLSIYREVFELERGAAWGEPTWIINVWPLSITSRSLAHFYDEPADARITVQRQVPSQFIDAKVKNRSRLHYALANNEMKGLPRNVIPLLLDDDGFICESTGANFVIIKDQKLIIPERRNMLRGCSMEFVVNRLAPALGIKVEERNIEPYDVLTANEAFFTGTFYNLIPCVAINGQRFASHTSDPDSLGPITREIVDAWNRHISYFIIEPAVIRSMGSRSSNQQFDFIKQIRGWNTDVRA
jgi:branched-chain amino acid aminotransferase